VVDWSVSCSDHLRGDWTWSIFQNQLAVLEFMAGEKQPQLIGCVDPAPVQTEPQDEFEDQVARVVRYA